MGMDMAVHFKCADPHALMRDFDARIAQTEPVGRITTWEKIDGRHYTHRSAEWVRKAFFKCEVQAGQLTFFIVKPRDSILTTRAYAYYHGHLIETFLAHFDAQFTAAVSALPEQGDVV